MRRHGLPFSEEEQRAIFAERVAAYSEFCRSGAVPLIEGMAETMNALAAAGRRVAVASNSLEEDILEILRHGGFADPAFGVVGRRRGLRPKPAPDIFIYAAGTLGVDPADCLVIEDSLKGLRAADAAGMACLIVRTPYNRAIAFPAGTPVLDGHAAFIDAVRSLEG